MRAGNRIIGGANGGDWPWPDSTILMLSFIFRSEPAPLPASLSFESFDYKKGEGDSICCVQHHIVVFAARPALEEFRSESVCVAYKRKARIEELERNS